MSPSLYNLIHSIFRLSPLVAYHPPTLARYSSFAQTPYTTCGEAPHIQHAQHTTHKEYPRSVSGGGVVYCVLFALSIDIYPGQCHYPRYAPVDGMCDGT